MRSIISLFLAALLLTLSLAGCSGSDAASRPDPQMVMGEGTVLSQTEQSQPEQGSGEVPPADQPLPSSSEDAGGSSGSSGGQESSQTQSSAQQSQSSASSSQSESSQPESSQSSSQSSVSSQPSSSQPSSSGGQNGSGSGGYTGDEYRAVWFSYLDLSGMLKGQSQSAFQRNIKAAFQNVSDLGCNVVLVQVRPFADALYESEYFPWSYLCTGTEGRSPGFDPLDVMIEEARDLGLEIEAWVNPYRVRPAGNNNAISSGSIASVWEEEEADYVIRYGGGVYLNPGREEVRQRIVDGVRELVENYQLDGIHFDDYFYPSPDDSFDELAYEEYRDKGGSLSLGDWRRENVNILLKEVYAAIKEEDASVRFGVSPQGNDSNNYNGQYIDVDEWLSHPGYVDYICPQIYFGFDNETHPFTETVALWNDKIKISGVSLYVGLAPYKIGQTDIWAGAGKNEWIADGSILARQVLAARENERYGGFALFRYASLFTPDPSVKSQVEKERNDLADLL